MSRTRLPDTRFGVTRKVELGGAKAYLTVNFYDDDTPGEIFITIAKEGSTLSGLVDQIAVEASLLLQHGVPWATIASKWQHTRFEPASDDFTSILDCFAHHISQIISDRGAPSPTPPSSAIEDPMVKEAVEKFKKVLEKDGYMGGKPKTVTPEDTKQDASKQYTAVEGTDIRHAPPPPHDEHLDVRKYVEDLKEKWPSAQDTSAEGPETPSPDHLPD